LKSFLKSKAENEKSLEGKVEKLSTDIERMKEKKAKKLQEKDGEIKNLQETIASREEMLRLFEAEKMKSEDVVIHDNIKVREIPSPEYISIPSIVPEIWSRLEKNVPTSISPMHWSRESKDLLPCDSVWDPSRNIYRIQPRHWSDHDAWTEDEDFYSNPMELRPVSFDGQSVDWNSN